MPDVVPFGAGGGGHEFSDGAFSAGSGDRSAGDPVLVEVAVDRLDAGIGADDQAQVAEVDCDVGVVTGGQRGVRIRGQATSEGVTDRGTERAGVGFFRGLFGQHDPRVEQPGWIERRLDRALNGDLDRGEALGHELNLLGADTVLTGDGAAQIQCSFDDLVVGRFQGGRRQRVFLVVERGGVQVAVARHDRTPQ